MKKFLEAVGTLAVAGAAATGLVYYLQKKGIVSVEVNYDEGEGNTVTRPFDEIIDKAAVQVGEKVKQTYGEVSEKVVTAAKGVKENLEDRFENVGADRKNGVTLPIQTDEA